MLQRLPSIVGLLLITAQAAAVAQITEPVPLMRLTAPVTLDGFSDEAAWQPVPALPMTMYSPTFRGEMTERTEVRVGYDDDNLYVSARMYDSDPSGIRANTFYRDRYSGDDVFAVLLDTYNDFENALWFAINPLGARTDRAVTNDAEIVSREAFEQTMNESWNTYWDVATARTSEGWFAELRIPLSSLRFENTSSDVVMGMSVYRYIARKNERHTFPAIPPDWTVGFAKPSRMQRVSLQAVEPKTPIYITPYALGGLNREPALNSAGTAYEVDTDQTGEIGLDIKYTPSSNLTVDATFNTDFAQVEVDDQQVNLTRFSLFFPEKRQFFQERSGLFEFNTGGFSRLFHSRTIGLFRDTPVRILGGARLIGRAGGTEVGALTMQTAASDSLTAENFGVLRVRRQVLNRYSNIGGLLTTRFGGGSRSGAIGLDGILRVVGDEYLTLKWAATFNDEGPEGLGVLDASRLIARWERRTQSGLAYLLDFIRSGRGYDPAVGFVVRDNFTFLGNTIGYAWLPGAESPFYRIAVQHAGTTYLKNGGATESALLQPSLTLEFKGGSQITIGADNSYERVEDPFPLSGGPDVLPDTYWFHEGRLAYRPPEGALFRPTLQATAGTFYDGWRTSLSIGPAWNVSRYLELGGDYILNVVRFPDRDERLNSHLVRFRVQAALNVHLSLSTFVQYNNAVDQARVNARVRYHFREGSDLWLVYDEGWNTVRDVVGGPRLPSSYGRTLLLKYTYTFIP